MISISLILIKDNFFSYVKDFNPLFLTINFPYVLTELSAQSAPSAAEALEQAIG